jgi:hypothetical protein
VTRLADLLDDVADQAKVYDVTDEAIRRVRRYRRVRRTKRVAMILVPIMVLALCLGYVPLMLLFGYKMPRPPGGPGREGGTPPALVQGLLNAPTKGPLATDKDFLAGVEDKIADNPDDYGMPADRSLLRILFAGDVAGGKRLVIVAGYTAQPAYIHLEAGAGSGTFWLRMTGWGDIEEPVLQYLNDRVSIFLGPAGYDVSTSDTPRYFADGTVHRDWKPEPGGYLMRSTAGLPPGLRVRFSQGAKILLEDKVASPGTRRRTNVDPTPLHGKVADTAAQHAADALAYSTGLTGPDVHYIVIWSDDYDVDPAGGQNPGQIAVVLAMTKDGGGPYLTLAVDGSKEPLARTSGNGGGIAGDPGKLLVVFRMPSFGALSPTVQIIAPSTAVRADLIQDGSVRSTIPLTDGLGTTKLAEHQDAVFKVYDTSGKLVAQQTFHDPTGPVNDSYEPRVQGW